MSEMYDNCGHDQYLIDALTQEVADLRKSDLEWSEIAMKSQAQVKVLREGIDKALNHIEYAAFNLCSEPDDESVTDCTCPEMSLHIGVRNLKALISAIGGDDD